MDSTVNIVKRQESDINHLKIENKQLMVRIQELKSEKDKAINYQQQKHAQYAITVKSENETMREEFGYKLSEIEHERR